jgi:dTDP-4-amino-4,6-dideoxygalactose transaminase
MLESNRFYQEIPLFENEFKDHLKVPYVKGHANCTSALMSAFFAVDLPRGSEVLAPSYTAWATTAPLHFFGYVPVFIDINPRTMTFDLNHARKKLTPKTRAVVPMHSFGNMCDMDQICAFAKENGLVVIEDAAQAQGATLQGRQAGTWGSIGCFSFQSSKILPTIEGGAGVYQTRDLYERATMFGNYELPSSFPEDSPYRTYAGTGMGPKFRIHPLAAAIARKQLPQMDRRNALVDAQVRKLTDRLVELPGISRPHCRPDATRVYWTGHMLFIDEAKAGAGKEALVKVLKAEGVTVLDGYYNEQHKFRLYSEPKWWHHPVEIPADLPGTTEVNRKAIKLPVYFDDASELIEQTVKAFEKVWAKRSQLS